MNPTQVAFFNQLAETICQSILHDLFSEFGVFTRQFEDGADQVVQLQQQLAEISARMDSAERAFPARHESRTEGMDAEELELTESLTSQQKALEAMLGRKAPK